MKKIFSGLIIITLLLCLGACQKDDNKGEFKTGVDGISIQTDKGNTIDVKTEGFQGDINGWDIDLGAKELQKLVETGEQILKDKEERIIEQGEKTAKELEIKAENLNDELEKKLETTQKELNAEIERIDKEIEDIEKSLEELINSLKN